MVIVKFNDDVLHLHNRANDEQNIFPLSLQQLILISRTTQNHFAVDSEVSDDLRMSNSEDRSVLREFEK